METETRACQHCKKSFTITPDDFSFYQKMQVPAPTWCPDCRLERRLLYRNFKTLYRRKSDLSGNTIISMFAPDAPYTVYESTEWWGDAWDGLSYGTDFDFNQPFFEQLNELAKKVPRPALQQTNCTNSPYINMATRSQNCYMVFGCVEDEDCDYGHIVWYCKNCNDNLYVHGSEACYECVDCQGSCNMLFYCQECEGCADSIALYDCRGCTNCIGCVGLVSKSYHIFNEPVDKETYKKFKDSLKPLSKQSIAEVISKRDILRKQIPQRAFFGFRNNDVSGNHLYNCHNVHDSFDLRDSENSKFAYTTKAIDCYDVTFTPTIESGYEVLICRGKNIAFSHLVTESHDVMYSEFCHNGHDLFGCVGLRDKSYCIFNKQYTKEEYLLLREKIIAKMKETGEYGEFFPLWMSPFAYNESTIYEYIPRTKEQATALGYRWREDIPATSGAETKNFTDIPVDVSQYDDSLLKEIFACEVCNKNFRLVSTELTFYKKFNIAIPRECFNCRQAARMHSRLARKLIDARCACCQKDIKTAYTKEQQAEYKVYCEQCYQKEMM